MSKENWNPNFNQNKSNDVSGCSQVSESFRMYLENMHSNNS